MSWINRSCLLKKPAIKIVPGTVLQVSNGKDYAVYTVSKIISDGGVLIIEVENQEERQPESNRKAVPVIFSERLHSC